MNTTCKNEAPHAGAKTSTRSWIIPARLAILLVLAVSTPAAPNLARTVTIGDSLLAGFRNGGLLDVYQQDGIAATIAHQAQINFPQPLVGWPGIPAVLELKNPGPPPDIQRASGSSTGRVDIFTQPFNLAVPGQTLSDAIRLAPNFPVDSLADLILGLPGLLGGVSKTQMELAEALQPTTVLVWIGNNDALNAAIAGDPSVMTPEAGFSADYKTLMDRLAVTGATIVVANIPDVTSIPYVQSVTNVAAMLGVPFEVFSAVLGVSADDFVNLDALSVIGDIFLGHAAPPLGAQYILTPAEISAIRERTAKFNLTIAQQATTHEAILIDTAALLAGWKANGVHIPGKVLSTDFLGGIFSLDGIHPTTEGAALTANAFIAGLNSAGASIPQVAWLNVLPAADHVTVQWSAGATGYELQTSDSMDASSWTTLTTLPADKSEQSFSKGTARTFFRLRHQ